MDKDREGKFHPQKGKPSGSGKEENIGLNQANILRIKDYLEISDRYAIDGKRLQVNVRTRHPNRKVVKMADRSSEKQIKTGKKYKKQTQGEEERVPLSWSEMTKELFFELAEINSPLAISIYLPTAAPGVEVNEQRDLITFKNELQFIEAEAKKRGAPSNEIENILKPANFFLESDVWLGRSFGLAAFLSHGYFKFIRIPYAPRKETVISNGFVLTHLVPLVINKNYFFLLVLSKKQARVYKISPFGILHIPIKEMPDGVGDVVHFEEKDDQQVLRTDSSGTTGGANFHGIGEGAPDEKEIALYFDEVDETLWKEILQTENAPLLLAGVDYLIPIFKQVSKYKNIYAEALTGSYEHESLQTLYEHSIKKIEPYFAQRAKYALDNYQNHSSTSLVTTQESEIIPAAHYGRVAQLFVQPHEHIWGQFNKAENQLQLREKPNLDDECLLNRSIIKTIVTGGEVFFLTEREMPDKSKMAALMRY